MKKFPLAISFVSTALSALGAMAAETVKTAPATSGVDLDALTAKGYYPSTLTNSIASLAPKYTVSLTQKVSKDTSKGACFINAAEVGSGLRLGGTFKVDQSVSASGWSVQFSPSTAARDPYMLSLSINLSDVSLVSQGAVDISVPCLGLDQKMTIKLKGIKATVVMGAPSTKRSTFRYDSTSISIDSITVTGEPNLLDATVAALIEAEINKSANKSEIAASVQSALGSSLSAFADIVGLYFAADMSTKGKTIHALTYYDTKESGKSSKCASYPCALYSIY